MEVLNYCLMNSYHKTLTLLINREQLSYVITNQGRSNRRIYWLGTWPYRAVVARGSEREDGWRMLAGTKCALIREQLCEVFPAWDPPEGISFSHEIIWQWSRMPKHITTIMLQRISFDKAIPSAGSQAGHISQTSCHTWKRRAPMRGFSWPDSYRHAFDQGKLFHRHPHFSMLTETHVFSLGLPNCGYILWGSTLPCVLKAILPPSPKQERARRHG